MAVGWEYRAEVVIEAPVDEALRWVPRTIGRLEAIDATRCRLIGSTSNPYWYAEQLAVLPVAYRIMDGPELRHAAREIGRRLLDAADFPPAFGGP